MPPRIASPGLPCEILDELCLIVERFAFGIADAFNQADQRTAVLSRTSEYMDYVTVHDGTHLALHIPWRILVVSRSTR
jgi:hypothetical protein